MFMWFDGGLIEVCDKKTPPGLEASADVFIG